MPLRWASCLFRPTRGTARSLEVNEFECPPELQEELDVRGTACLRPRGAHVLYERVDDAGQGAFTPPVLIYIKRLPLSSGLDVCVKRTLITHFVGRAAREARLQVQLQHPHLLPALASVRGRHHYYLVLPAAESDLWAEAEVMRQQGTGYTEDELRAVARQMLLGLEHLHASNLAHRDIKPANVLRMPDGRVAVADFGCSDGCTAGFVAAGTTQFQPPECRRNTGAQMAVLPKGYDQRAQDMWGVGATLASLWFARMPDVVRGGNSRATSSGTGLSGVTRRASTSGSFPTPPQSTLGEEASSGDASVSVDVDGAVASSAPFGGTQVARCLVAAGFGGCSSTMGACGVAMSQELLDLMGGLLRARPSDRLTASQALHHPWLAEAGRVGAAGAASPPVGVVTPLSIAQPTASSPSSPLKRLRTSGDGPLLPFLSHQQLLLQRTSPPQEGQGTPPLPPRPPQRPNGLLEGHRPFSPLGRDSREASPHSHDGSSPAVPGERGPAGMEREPAQLTPRGDAPTPSRQQSPWMRSALLPSPTKRSPHTVLRVFVGADAEASGSN